VIFIYILQGKIGKAQKKTGKKNHATKVSKIQKTKRRILMNESKMIEMWS
jgi:hypothetical protein